MNYSPKFNEQKATEAAALLLDMKGGRVEYLWLLKVLYAIDREAFNRWERPVTYDVYKSLPKGPVPMTAYNLITGYSAGAFWKNCILTYPVGSANEYEIALNGPTMPKIRHLSDGEIDLIREKVEEFKDMTSWDMVDYTHKHFPEWKDPHDGPWTPIEIEEMLKYLDFPPGDIERIKRELREEEAINVLFSG